MMDKNAVINELYLIDVRVSVVQSIGADRDIFMVQLTGAVCYSSLLNVFNCLLVLDM